MSIASAIQAKQQQVADSYTAVSNKGGTLPATQNLSNLPTAIGSIPSGSTSEKYGMDINNFLGDINSNGVLQSVPVGASVDFSGVKDMAKNAIQYRFQGLNISSVNFQDLEAISGDYACNYAFSYQLSRFTSINFPKLAIISGKYACSYMFSGCKYITSASLPSLTTISGSSACEYMFYNNIRLTTVNLSSLTTISGSYACNRMLASSTALTTVNLPTLTTISGNSACIYMFSNDNNLTDVYFNALNTSSFGSNKNQFNYILSSTGKTKTHTLHFPSNMQSTISGLTGYPLFGGTSGYVTLSFDLPATS